MDASLNLEGRHPFCFRLDSAVIVIVNILGNRLGEGLKGGIILFKSIHIWISPVRCPRRMQSSISSQKTPKYKKLSRKRKTAQNLSISSCLQCRWWGSPAHWATARRADRSPCKAGPCCSTRSHAADKKENSPRQAGEVLFLCRWWGSNPHVLLAQGILSFYPHLPSGVIQWYLVISGSHCAKAKFTPQRTIIWNIHDFSMRFPPTLFFRFGPPKWKLEGCSGGMQGKTLLCLGTKRKESQG